MYLIQKLENTMVTVVLILAGIVLIVMAVRVPGTPGRRAASAAIGIMLIMAGMWWYATQPEEQLAPSLAVVDGLDERQPVETPLPPPSQIVSTEARNIIRGNALAFHEGVREAERMYQHIPTPRTPPSPPTVQTRTQENVSAVPDGRNGVIVTFFGYSGIIETGLVLKKGQTAEISTPRMVDGLAIGRAASPRMELHFPTERPEDSIVWSSVPAHELTRTFTYTLMSVPQAMVVLDTRRVGAPGPHTVHVRMVPHRVMPGTDAQGRPLNRIYP